LATFSVLRDIVYPDEKMHSTGELRIRYDDGAAYERMMGT